MRAGETARCTAGDGADQSKRETNDCQNYLTSVKFHLKNKGRIGGCNPIRLCYRLEYKIPPKKRGTTQKQFTFFQSR